MSLFFLLPNFIPFLSNFHLKTSKIETKIFPQTPGGFTAEWAAAFGQEEALLATEVIRLLVVSAVSSNF